MYGTLWALRENYIYAISYARSPAQTYRHKCVHFTIICMYNNKVHLCLCTGADVHKGNSRAERITFDVDDENVKSDHFLLWNVIRAHRLPVLFVRTCKMCTYVKRVDTIVVCMCTILYIVYYLAIYVLNRVSFIIPLSSTAISSRTTFGHSRAIFFFTNNYIHHLTSKCYHGTPCCDTAVWVRSKMVVINLGSHLQEEAIRRWRWCTHLTYVV